jgi:hypothetical protein
LGSSEQAEEERQRADNAIAQFEAERQRKEILVAKLRELAIDPDAE